MVGVQVVYHAPACDGSAQRHPRAAVMVILGDGGGRKAAAVTTALLETWSVAVTRKVKYWLLVAGCW